MTTPASFAQYRKLDNLLGNPSSDRLQHLLANGRLLRMMVDADLSKVDHSAFKDVLTPKPAPIAWRPVNEYAEKITKWNNLRGWGFTKAQINRFAQALVDHAGPLQPTGVSLWLGRDLAFNWEEVTICLQLEVEALDAKFAQYVGSNLVSFYPGSEQDGGRKLTVALLDLQTYWNPVDGVVPNEVRAKEARLPGLEVAWLLAFNPQVFLAIDCKVIPGMIATGLVVGSGSVPEFSRSLDYWTVVTRFSAGSRCCDLSVVRFRE